MGVRFHQPELARAAENVFTYQSCGSARLTVSRLLVLSRPHATHSPHDTARATDNMHKSFLLPLINSRWTANNWTRTWTVNTLNWVTINSVGSQPRRSPTRRWSSSRDEIHSDQGRTHGRGGGEGPTPLGPEKHYIFRVSSVKLRESVFLSFLFIGHYIFRVSFVKIRDLHI